MISAIKQNSLWDVQYIIQKKLPNQDLSDKTKLNCLQLAIIGENLDITEYLVKQGFLGDPLNNKTIISAIKTSNHDLLKLLLDYGAVTNVQDEDFSNSPVLIAIQHSDLKTVQMILSRSGRMTQTIKRRALQTATKHGHVEIVRLLLENDTDILHSFDDIALRRYTESRTNSSDSEKCDNQVSTEHHPVLIAAQENHVPLLDVFHNYIDINTFFIVEDKITSCLHVAAKHGNVDAIYFTLTRFGGNINQFDSDKNTILHTLISRPHNEKYMRPLSQYKRCAELLLNMKIKATHQNKDGDTVLHIAVKNGFLDIAKMIHSSNKEISCIHNTNGLTPIELCDDDDVAMRLLFTAVADPTTVYPDLTTHRTPDITMNRNETLPITLAQTRNINPLQKYQVIVI